MGHVKKNGKLFLIASMFFAIMVVNCQSPIEKPDPASDLIEFESVWQYLKAFSIHQDAVPADPFAFAAPSMLMDAVHDTLKASTNGNYSYTCYNNDVGIGAAGASAALSAAAAMSSDYPWTVFFDSLTPTTACLTDTGFESWTWNDFQACAVPAEKFPNIVIDLRHNRGGQLDILDSIVSALVPLNTSYIQAQDREFDKKTKSYITNDWHPWITHDTLLSWFHGRKKKYVVIMDDWTASASEIFASAMYEGFHAKLIGIKSYGKGMGQIILDRRTRQSIQITFLYIKGVSPRIGNYHRIGITPDDVPQSIVQQADSAMSPWFKEVFYAVKMLEPGVTPSSMNYPRKQFNAKMSAKMSSGLYKVIKEEDVGK
jgi:hypothetical protein